MCVCVCVCFSCVCVNVWMLVCNSFLCQSSCRVSRNTLSGYFLAGRDMAWWPVSVCVCVCVCVSHEQLCDVSSTSNVVSVERCI